MKESSRNQPKYHFFKNTSYALSGVQDLAKSETSFKIELIFFIALLPFIVFIDVEFTHKLLMFITLSGVLIAETINAAIERTVDLVTLEYHHMAKRAKDVGSAVVFFSITLCVITWLSILHYHYL